MLLSSLAHYCYLGSHVISSLFLSVAKNLINPIKLLGKEDFLSDINLLGHFGQWVLLMINDQWWQNVDIIGFSLIVTFSLVGSISFQPWIYNNLPLNVKLHSAAINLVVIQNLDISTNLNPGPVNIQPKNRLNIRLDINLHFCDKNQDTSYPAWLSVPHIWSAWLAWSFSSHRAELQICFCKQISFSLCLPVGICRSRTNYQPWTH